MMVIMITSGNDIWELQKRTASGLTSNLSLALLDLLLYSYLRNLLSFCAIMRINGTASVIQERYIHKFEYVQSE